MRNLGTQEVYTKKPIYREKKEQEKH
jgi:hypothetical protein